jgi:hypothetical protein
MEEDLLDGNGDHSDKENEDGDCEDIPVRHE